MLDKKDPSPEIPKQTFGTPPEKEVLKKKTAFRDLLLFLFAITVCLVLILFRDGITTKDSAEISANIASSLKKVYGGIWTVELDKTQQIPKSVNVPGLKTTAYSQNFSKIEKENAFEVSKEFISKNSDVLKVEVKDLKEAKVWDGTLATDKNQQFVIVHMKQVHDGIPVETGLVSTIFHNDELVKYSNSWLLDISAPTKPKINAQEAFNIAKKSELSRPAPVPRESDLKLYESELVILPAEKESKKTYHLAWKIWFKDVIKPALTLVYYVDAISGSVIKRENRIRTASVSGYILGGMYPEDPTRGRDSHENLQKFVIKALGADGTIQAIVETDENGHYVIDGLPGGIQHRIYYNFFNTMPGNTTIVAGDSENGGEANLAFDVIPPAVNSINWEDSDDSYKKEISNVWYHLRAAKNFFNRGAPFDIPGLGQDQDLDVQAIVGDQDWVCNAAAGGFTIRFGMTGNNENGFCEAASLGSDIIYHEFTHLITNAIYASNPIDMNSSMERSLDESFSDYFAASMTDDSIHAENILPGERRNLQNNLRYSVDWDSTSNPDVASHANIRILGGALWDFRTKMIEIYGIDEGIAKADERIFMAIKMLPRDIWSVMDYLLFVDDDFGGINDGTPHMQEICDAFNYNHGIWHPVCDTIEVGQPELGWNDWGIPADGTFISSFPSLFPLIGSASAPDQQTEFVNYSIEYRGFNKPTWENDGVLAANAVTNIGTQPVDVGKLGTIESNKLIPGCFYEARLNVQTSAGVTPTNVVFQKLPGSQPTMPRMVCVYRTANEGSDNDACEVIALASDPKPSFYSLATTDWRRGRDWRLVQGAAGREQIVPRQGMCDPDYADGSCADDCWNISGVNGNGDDGGGNNGWDNVFCKAGSGCSPVSFSGCPSDDATCIENALTGLESVYHKVVYLHWANADPGGLPDNFVNCADDNGTQMYAVRNKRTSIWRTGQCAYPRCEKVFPGDVLDGFDKLYTDSDGYGNLEYLLFYEPSESHNRQPNFVPKPRVSESPSTKCATCGCPGNSPYCNTTADICEQKCFDGQPLNTCKPVTVGGVSAAHYCKVEDFSTYKTKYACGSLCSAAQCPTIADNFGTPQKLVCNSDIGYCVACRSNADCNQNPSCTIGTCNNPGTLNSSCSYERAFPNDCPANQVCGSSPSGCYTCGSGCPTGRMCSNNSCVRDPSYVCNPLKEKCDVIRDGTRPTL